MSRTRQAFAAVCVGLTVLAFAPVVPAAEPDCSTFALDGVSPGMTVREVRRLLGGKGIRGWDDISADGEVGVNYDRPPGSLYVQYDGGITRKFDARVRLVRMRTAERSVDISTLTGQLLERFGEPISGREHLAGGLREGSTVWVDPRCGVEITASREMPGWWESPEGATVQVEIRPLSAERRIDLPEATVTDVVPRDEIDSPAEIPGEVREAEIARAPQPIPASETDRPGTTSALDDSTTEKAVEVTDRNRQEPIAVEVPVSEPETIFLNPAPDTVVDDGEPLQTVPFVPGVDGVTSPVRIEKSYVRPRYPALARRYNSDGRVQLQVVVRRDGTVGETEVLQAFPTGHGFEVAAERAVKRWRYEPATRNGEPVDAVVTVVVNFKSAS